MKDCREERPFHAETAMVVAENSSTRTPFEKTAFSEKFPEVDMSVIEKCLEGIETIGEIFHLFGLRREDDRPGHRVGYHESLVRAKSSAVQRMLEFVSAGGCWMGYLKFKTLNFYAHFETEGNDMMPSIGLSNDRADCLIGGVYYAYQRLLQRKDELKFSEFILTMNMAKMGLPRPTVEMVRKKEWDTARHLTTEPKPLPPDKTIGGQEEELLSQSLYGHSAILNRQNFEFQLIRLVDEMFEEAVFTEADLYEPFYPSTSANYNRSRSKGGAVGSVYEVLGELGVDPTPSILVKKVRAVASSPVSEKYGAKGVAEQAELDEMDLESEVDALEYDDSAFRKWWTEVYQIIYKRAIEEKPLVEPVGLSEALKVRVISKGPPLLYTSMVPLQKFLWSSLKKNSVFKLIGTPVTDDFINLTFGIIGRDELIINGDYKASTDNLHSWVSECLARAVVARLNANGARLGVDHFILDEQFESLLIRSLTGHKFLFPDGTERDQKEGQLMGSVTSFPFLCMANAAMCRWALEMSNWTPYRLRDKPYNRRPLCPLIVNGDDCAMKGRREREGVEKLRPFWLQITSFGGLESSLGKTIFSLAHRPVVVINSQTFDYKEGLWVTRKYVNMGIMMGKPRSVLAGTQEDRVPYERLGSQHRELHESCPTDVWSEVSARFIHYNRAVLTEYPDIPWSIPEYLGGPGLVPKDGEISRFDRTVATFILATGLTKKVRRAQTLPEWQLHQIVNKTFSEVDEQNFRHVRHIHQDDIFTDFPKTESIEDNSSLLYKLLTVETLKRNSLNDVYRQKSQSGRVKQAPSYSCRNSLLSNNRLWAKAAFRCRDLHIDFPELELRTTAELLYEKKFSGYPTLMAIL